MGEGLIFDFSDRKIKNQIAALLPGLGEVCNFTLIS